MAEQENNTSRRRARKPQPVDNTYGHLQPQALEVEKAVLGALMIDKDAYAVVCETLRPDHGTKYGRASRGHPYGDGAVG